MTDEPTNIPGLPGETSSLAPPGTPAPAQPAALADPAPGDNAPAPAVVPEAAPAAAPAPGPEPTLLDAFDASKTPPDPAKPAEPAPAVDAKKPDGEAPKPAEAKPADVKPADAPKPEDVAKPDPAAAAALAADLAPITYTDFTLPEGFGADKAVMDQFTSVLGESRIPQEVGQKLLDMHAQHALAQVDQLSKYQHDVFNETRKGWRTQVMADEVLGGSGHQTAMGVVARMRDKFVPEGDREAFRQMLGYTGVGDHPLFLRMMHNIGRAFDEGPPPPPNPQPPKNAGKGRRGVLYDHPTSNRQ